MAIVYSPLEKVENQISTLKCIMSMGGYNVKNCRLLKEAQYKKSRLEKETLN